MSEAALGLVVPGMPHVLLAADQNAGYARLKDAYAEARRRIEESGADLLVLYSTQWASIIGHQIQADPEPVWNHVDPEWHELGSMPYKFRIDVDFAQAYEKAAKARGLPTRTVAYHGFPIDTGSVVALKLLNPDNALPATMVSCNMYADRAETIVLGKAGADAAHETGRRPVAIAVTALSNRLHTKPIPFAQDRISSLKDDEWNKKLLELFAEGRLEDVSQLARTFSQEANGDNKMKAIWWLAAFMGQHNHYEGEVLAYEPVWGTGATVTVLKPSERAAQDQEFDEEDVDVYQGDRDVLTAAADSEPIPEDQEDEAAVDVATDKAPAPVGAYPHARRVGQMLYLSGVGPRQPGTNAIPGGPVRDAKGKPRDYDVAAQTRATIENVKKILEASGSSLEHVQDVTAFLIDMDRDFETFNKVYAQAFGKIRPTRTTLAVQALPTPIAVELKVIATVK